MFATKTDSTKKLSAVMTKEARSNDYIRFEHNLAFYSAGDHPSRPGRHNVSGAEIEAIFSRVWGDAEGASKVVHLYHPDGTPFKYVCVKRDKKYGTVFTGFGSGIQNVNEIKAWEALAGTPDADCLCPIFKYFMPKSDRAGVEKTRQRVTIICQKAVYISSLADCCKEAERRNRMDGKTYVEEAWERQAKIEKLCRRMGWHDIIGRGMGGGGRNCGVIYDYHSDRYKAVIVDYAL